MCIAKVGFLGITGPEQLSHRTYMYAGLHARLQECSKHSDVLVRQRYGALVVILMRAIEQITACFSVVRDSIVRSLIVKQGYSEIINIVNH